MASAPHSRPETALAEPDIPSSALPSPQVPDANERHADSLSLTDRLALRITSAVGTMACVAAFAVIALISLPAAIRTHNIIVIISWIAQTFLQLVLLPMLMVGQNLQGRHAETRAQADYEVNCKAFADAEKMLARLEAIDTRILALTEAHPADPRDIVRGAR